MEWSDAFFFVMRRLEMHIQFDGCCRKGVLHGEIPSALPPPHTPPGPRLQLSSRLCSQILILCELVIVLQAVWIGQGSRRFDDLA
jgi:hypothetical protein